MNKISGRLFAWLTMISSVVLFNGGATFANEMEHTMDSHSQHNAGHKMEHDGAHEMKHAPDHPMDHSRHKVGNLPKNFEEPAQGVKEVKIDLKGPFCQKHPEEIRGALMKLSGVKAVEAFNGRKYVVIQYTGAETTPEQMGITVSGLKGSGWRCNATLAKY